MNHPSWIDPVLQQPVSDLKGIGPARQRLLKKLGVETIEDALSYFPFRYEDRSRILPIASCRPGLNVMIEGEVTRSSLISTRRGFKILTLSIRDRSGEIQALWFNQPYLKNVLEKGLNLRLFGRIISSKTPNQGIRISNPEYEFF